MAETKRGRLGVGELAPLTNTVVYEVTSAMDSKVNICLTNHGTVDCTVNIAIVDGGVADIANEDYIRCKLPIEQNETVTISNINMNADEVVVCYATKSGVTVRVDGIEEDEAGSSVLPSIQKITQTLTYADFTDGGGTTGTAILTTQLPAGAVPVGWKAVVTAAFSGDTACLLIVGVSGDIDRFSSDTKQSIFTTGIVASGVPTDACDGIEDSQDILVTAAAASDWGSVSSSASLNLEVYYIATA